MEVQFQIMHFQNDKWEKSDALKTMHAIQFKLNHANDKNLIHKKISTLQFWSKSKMLSSSSCEPAHGLQLCVHAFTS